MSTASKIPHGTLPWFHMVGTVMCEAARNAGLSPDLTVSLVERYSDGEALSDGLVQGLRFDIVAGRPTYRIGALPAEPADIEIEVSAAGARALNLLSASDPRYPETLGRLLDGGDLRVTGDIARFGTWFGAALHDAIVERTA
ncbi:hypothetical protein [Segnochrobactrum spirostomi]|uniref:SCP2 domain-containing protein n=1 Tax=Segnochrobactrum spirostomi TaxID=2608987 RepID=A0A6A7Y7W0_9HYPH|nr:hypothetical protein [Segnochrobactrum spirostomi]MQT15440.1 hypothetical protein [Segnochrobactrum spirostomi]